ncbi:RHS repeat-associated core domain-containing protein [Serratia ureilytica]|uniref:RHS repeat-associated core domain-containing protein n=1 Tax=Serratia ureilytica TaxID=300181 RepID=UPI00313CEE03
MADFFTQATNFRSAVSGNVDPRTGLFNISIDFGRISANNQLGPGIPLSFGYSPLETNDFGLGTGFTFGHSYYDKTRQILMLSTGEAFQVIEPAGRDAADISVRQQKLKNFIFSRLKEGGYRVIHKDGSVEDFYADAESSCSIRVPRIITSAQGQSIVLDWNNNGILPVLKSIRDTTSPEGNIDRTGTAGHELLSIQPHPETATCTISVLRGTPEAYTLTLSFSNKYLMSIRHSGLPDKTWKIDYGTFSGNRHWAQSVIHPGGKKESVRYTKTTNFPAGSSLKPLPCVYTFTTSRVDEKNNERNQVVITYQFSPKNFLTVCNWNSKDNSSTFPTATTTTYSSTQWCTDVTSSLTTCVTRTYNNYHLMTRQESKTGVLSEAGVFDSLVTHATVTQDFEFDITPSKSYEDQVAWCQLPLNTTTTWQKTSEGKKCRKEKITSTYDKDGNILTQQTTIHHVDEQGVETVVPSQNNIVWEYYSPDGEVDDDTQGTGCPKDDYGFTRFVKSMTSTPALPTPDYKKPKKVTRYRYGALQMPNEAGLNSAPVVVKSECNLSDAQLLEVIDYTYADAGTENWKTHGLGRVIQKDNTWYPDGVEGDKYKSTVQHDYTVDAVNDTLTCEHTFTSHDNIVTTTSDTHSRFTSLLLEEVSVLGVKNTYEYDALGRKTGETLGAEKYDKDTSTFIPSDYAGGTSYDYVINGDEDTPFTVTSVSRNLSGNPNVVVNQTRTHYNFVNQPISSEVSLSTAKDAPVWNVMQTCSYDSIQRPLTASMMDYHLPTTVTEKGAALAGHTADQTITMDIAWDDWGNNQRISTNDGVISLELADPVAMTLTRYSTGKNGTQTPIIVSTNNENAQVVSVEVYADTCRVGRDGKVYLNQAEADKANNGEEAIPANPYSIVTNKYDALNQLRKQTDEMQRSTVYDYDLSGRLTTTTLPDGTQLQKAYSPFSSQSWLTKISVKVGDKTTLLGTQLFDGLGRLTTSTSGGRTWSAIYDIASGSLTLPYTVTSPDGNRTAYTYIPELGGALLCEAGIPLMTSDIPAAMKDSKSRKDYTYYNLKTGQVESTGALNTTTLLLDETLTPDGQPKNTTLSYKYEDSGRLSKEVFSTSLTQTLRDHTVAGKNTSYTDVAGKKTTMTYDSLGRTEMVSDPEVTVELHYDDLSRPWQWTTTDVRTLVTTTTTIKWDNLGREIARTLVNSAQSDNNREITQEWNASGLLVAKTISIPSDKGVIEAVLRKEIYAYDIRNRLLNMTISGLSTEYPQDEQGRNIQVQAFKYDTLNNVIQVVSTFADGTTDTATFYHEHPEDPCRLTAVQHTSPDTGKVSLTWSDAGYMKADGTGRTYQYYSSVLEGRLKSAAVQGGEQAQYHYDAAERLARRNKDRYYHNGSRRVTIMNDNGTTTRLIPGPNGNVAQSVNSRVWLAGTDGHGTVLSKSSQDDGKTFSYTPGGEHAAKSDEEGLPGYNGEAEDSVSGGYLMGGNRLYRPDLHRFISPDSLSPFGAGGINPYCYCDGDPLNYTDPTGHFKVRHLMKDIFNVGMAVAGVGLAIYTGGGSLAITGAVCGVVSATTGVAGDAVKNSSPGASKVLGNISLASGIASTCFNIGSGVQAAKGVYAEGKEAAKLGLKEEPHPAIKTRGGGRVGGGMEDERVNIEYKASAKGRSVWDDSIHNENGTHIMASNQSINATNVEDAVHALMHDNNKDILILTGNHGYDHGNNWGSSYLSDKLIERAFAREDRYNTSMLPRVSVRNLSKIDKGEFKRIVTQTDKNIILAYCFSRNDNALLAARNLPSVTSYYIGAPEYLEFMVSKGYAKVSDKYYNSYMIKNPNVYKV